MQLFSHLTGHALTYFGYKQEHQCNSTKNRRAQPGFLFLRAHFMKWYYWSSAFTSELFLCSKYCKTVLYVINNTVWFMGFGIYGISTEVHLYKHVRFKGEEGFIEQIGISCFLWTEVKTKHHRLELGMCGSPASSHRVRQAQCTCRTSLLLAHWQIWVYYALLWNYHFWIFKATQREHQKG